jgi:iron complex outermembrane recepter protein
MMRLFTAVLSLCLTLPTPGGAAGWDDGEIDLLALSLEELMGIEVSLVSRTQQSLFETPAALFVLTADDVRRSGATNVQEALRLVPGVQAARSDANKWAISARGFADRFANKLLVLIDGRHLYSPIFSGVFWEGQDLLLEDIERIEVVRGPGATLWGANAVNGIINIVTKEAEQTQGARATLRAGSETRGGANIRYGGQFGERAFYRVYAQYSARDDFVDASGRRAADGSELWHGGFRSEYRHNERDAFSLQGDLIDGYAGQTTRFPIPEMPYLRSTDEETQMANINMLARLERTLSSSADFSLQFYYDRSKRMDSTADVKTDAFDIDFQHRRALGVRHQLSWGAGYRLDRDNLQPSFKLGFVPQERSTHLFSAFVHDELTLIRERLRWALGAKLEHNGYTGFEYQPSTRLLWTPTPHQTLWAAATRAVRTPARSDSDVRLAFRFFPSQPADPDAGPPIGLFFHGEGGIVSEKMRAYELGYRAHPTDALLFDFAAYYNDYDDLRSVDMGKLEPRIDGPTPYVANPLRTDNSMTAVAHGIEMAAEWQLAKKRGRLRASYTYTELDIDVREGGLPDGPASESVPPTHQGYIWSSLNLSSVLQLDAIMRYVGEINAPAWTAGPQYNPYLPDRNIDSYFELDLRLAWRLTPRVELDINGQNLLAAHHPEFVDFFLDTRPSETQRGVYSSVRVDF